MKFVFYWKMSLGLPHFVYEYMSINTSGRLTQDVFTFNATCLYASNFVYNVHCAPVSRHYLQESTDIEL